MGILCHCFKNSILHSNINTSYALNEINQNSGIALLLSSIEIKI